MVKELLAQTKIDEKNFQDKFVEYAKNDK